MEISANDNYSYVSSEENWSAVYEELDEEISLDEISSVIAKLKPNKNCGENYILKEIFKICKSSLLPLFHIMFNNIFECGYLPDAWSKAFFVPLLKKGDKTTKKIVEAFLLQVASENYLLVFLTIESLLGKEIKKFLQMYSLILGLVYQQ